MVGAHPAVPDVVVEAIVAASLRVVHIVVGSGIKPLAYRMIHKARRKQLVAQVADDIKKQGPKSKYKQHQGMKGDNQNNQGHNSYFG